MALKPLYEVGVGKEFTAIQPAVDQVASDAAAGLTMPVEIRIYAGTYTSALNVPNVGSPTATNKLTIRANSGDLVTIIPAWQWMAMPYLVLEGLTFNGGYVIYGSTCNNFLFTRCKGQTSMQLWSVPNGTIENCNMELAMGFPGGPGVSGSPVIVQNNRFYTSTGFSNLSHMIIRNNIFEGTTYNQCITTLLASCGVSIYNNIFVNAGASQSVYLGTATSGAVVYNNTFYNCRISVYTTGTASSNIVKNNIFYIPESPYMAVKCDAGALSNTFDYNLYYRSSTGIAGSWNGTSCTNLSDFQVASSQEAHAVSGNPKFVSGFNVGVEAYKLDKFSPAKRTGTDLTSVVANDMLGTPREIPHSMGALITNRDVI